MQKQDKMVGWLNLKIQPSTNIEAAVLSNNARHHIICKDTEVTGAWWETQTFYFCNKTLLFLSKDHLFFLPVWYLAYIL